jgi:hypothetical protein
MNQNIWGPHLWFSLHTISFNYPLEPTEDDKEKYNNFYLNLQHVIPCSVCKKNYQRHLKEHPLNNYLTNRKKLVYWVIDMHNMVNSEIGKKILSYDIVIKKYEDVYKKKIVLDKSDEILNEYNIKNTNIDYIKIVFYILFILFILFIINFLYMLMKCNT